MNSELRGVATTAKLAGHPRRTARPTFLAMVLSQRATSFSPRNASCTSSLSSAESGYTA